MAWLEEDVVSDHACSREGAQASLLLRRQTYLPSQVQGGKTRSLTKKRLLRAVSSPFSFLFNSFSSLSAVPLSS